MRSFGNVARTCGGTSGRCRPCFRPGPETDSRRPVLNLGCRLLVAPSRGNGMSSISSRLIRTLSIGRWWVGHGSGSARGRMLPAWLIGRPLCGEPLPLAPAGRPAEPVSLPSVKTARPVLSQPWPRQLVLVAQSPSSWNHALLSVFASAGAQAGGRFPIKSELRERRFVCVSAARRDSHLRPGLPPSVCRPGRY